MAKTFLYAPILTKNPVEDSKKSCDECFLKHSLFLFFALPPEYDFSKKTLYENDFLFNTIKRSNTYPFLCIAYICMFCVHIHTHTECEFPFAWTELLQFYLSWNYYYLQRPQLSARFSYMFAIKCERARMCVCLYHCWWSKTITFRFGCNPTFTFSGSTATGQRNKTYQVERFYRSVTLVTDELSLFPQKFFVWIEQQHTPAYYTHTLAHIITFSLFIVYFICGSYQFIWKTRSSNKETRTVSTFQYT